MTTTPKRLSPGEIHDFVMNMTNRKPETLLKDVPYKPSVSDINKRNREYWQEKKVKSPPEFVWPKWVYPGEEYEISIRQEETKAKSKPKVKPKPVIDLNPKRKFDFG